MFTVRLREECIQEMASQQVILNLYREVRNVTCAGSLYMRDV